MATKPSYEELEQMVKELQEKSLQRKLAEVEVCETTRRLEVAYDQAISYAHRLNDEIAERRRAEKGLQKVSEEQTILLDNIDTQVWYLTDIETHGAVNRALAEFLGVQKSDIAYKNMYDILSKEEAEVCIAGNREVFESKRQVRTEEWVKNGRGELRLVSVSKTPKLDKDGNVEYVVCAAEDITDRRKSEEALRASERDYRGIIENMIDVYYRADLEGNVILFSPSALKLLGYDSIEEVIGKNLAKELYYHPEDRDVFITDFKKYGKVTNYEVTLKRKDGTPVVGETSSSFVYDESGKPVAVEGIFRDLTERKQAEKALQESGEKLRTFMDSVTDFFSITDENENLVYVNRSMAETLGYSKDEMIGMHIAEVVSEESMMNFGPELTELVTTGKLNIESTWLTKDGRKISGELNVNAIFDKDGKYMGSRGVFRDITERKRAEQALKESESQLRALGSRLSEEGESQRKELARELHDRVGQNLTVLGINLNLVRSSLQDEAEAEQGARIDDALRLVEDTAKDIRDVMAELRPPVLDDYGLIAALRWYCGQFSERTGIAAMVQGDESMARVSMAVETSLFRIAQEGLTNVAKHAQASQVTVTLERVPEGVRLAIVDDGVGFDPESVRWTVEQPRWGLLAIRERAAAVGGQLHVKSEPGQGTEVVVEVRSPEED